MMMGFGSYGNGGGSSSSSSNLSALAPPFTVHRSVSKPLVDLTEPPLNWLNTQPLTFDSSSNVYPYPFSSPSPSSDSIKTSNFVEAKPYYPSYISHDYTQSLSSLWEGSTGWNYGKNEMNVSDLPIYKDHNDQAGHPSNVLNACEGKSNMLGSEKHLGSGNIEQFDYKPFPGQNTEFMPVEYSNKIGSSVLFPDTYSLLSPSEHVRSRNHQIPYVGSYEKDVKQHSISPNDITYVRKSSPGLVIRSAVGSIPSAPNTSSFNNVEIGSFADNMEFGANSNFPQTKDFHTMESSGSNVRFDSSKASFHLEGDNHSFPEVCLEKNEKLLSNLSVIKDTLRASLTQVNHTSPAGLNLTLDGSGSSNCFENSSVDYNPAVDSPCWKGAPVSHCFPLETSGPVPPQPTKTTEACSGSNLFGSTSSAVKFCSQKSSDFSLYQGYGCPENDLSRSTENLSVANMLFRELGPHKDGKEGSYHSKSSYGHGLQLSDDMETPRKEYTLSKKVKHELNFKPFHFTQQSLEDGKLTSENKCESENGIADVGRVVNSDFSEGCSSHVPFHATEHVLSSPPPVEVASSSLPKLDGEELAPKISVQMLINTMHNLSELLLFHCSNEACELKKEDLSVLKNVVNNLDKCISKNLGPAVTSQKSFYTEKTSQVQAELPELHEAVTVSRLRTTGTAAVTNLNQPDCQHSQEERKHYISSIDEKFGDFVFTEGDADRIKDDDMIQAIKKVLGENFTAEGGVQSQTLLYKNLWLEAEAALCSINYKARFNRMKIKIEKWNSLKAQDLSGNAAVTSDLSKNSAEVEKLSLSTFSSDTNRTNKLKSELNDDSTQNISAPKSPIITTSSHPDDVMARFHILECQVRSANCTSTTDEDKVCSSKGSHDSNKFDKRASEVNDEQTANISSWDLPLFSQTTHRDDVEAAVMARLQILKGRIDNISCKNMDELPTQAADLGFTGVKKNGLAEDEISDVSTEPVLQRNFASHTEDKLTMDVNMEPVKDDPAINVQTTNRLGYQLSAACYDTSSSDWEHVLKEELPGQNC